METLVALLRAVNVGGRNRLPMAELRAELSGLGLESVATVLQSGNAVFAGDRPRDEIASAIEGRIREAFGLSVAVLLRTADELGEIARANPFLAAEPDEALLHVAFLDRVPDAAASARLDPGRSPPDAFALRGSEVYLHYPHGSGRSRLNVDYLERTLGVRATARNWRTVTRLVEAARAGGA